MSSLDDLVARIRAAVGIKAIVPGFDPSNGNESSKFLLLLEAPGPQAASDKGIVSFDNNDPTARNLRDQLAEAGIQRSEVVIWNVVPWYIGEEDQSKIRAARSSDIKSALQHLDELIKLLPNLECIVLVGAAARKAHVHLSITTNVRILSCHHPSGRVRNSNPASFSENVLVFKAMKERHSVTTYR